MGLVPDYELSLSVRVLLLRVQRRPFPHGQPGADLFVAIGVSFMLRRLNHLALSQQVAAIAALMTVLVVGGLAVFSSTYSAPVSYTHLTLPTKRIV